MAKAIADLSLSLDGLIANPTDGVAHRFGWCNHDDVSTPSASPRVSFRTTEVRARHLHDVFATAGVLIAGCRLYDVGQAWGGTRPIGLPIVVVTHSPSDSWPLGDTSSTFVIDGVERTVAQANAIAGDKHVGAASAASAQQCVTAGLLAAIAISLAPVRHGSGYRCFDHLARAPAELTNPRALQSDRVPHMSCRVTAHRSRNVSSERAVSP